MTNDNQQFQIKEFKEIIANDSANYITRYQYKTLWTYVFNGILGLLLITGPLIFNYKSSSLVISDTVSGALIILFEWLSFSPKRYLFRWLTPVVALWLLFAPLLFWSPTPAVYIVDTLVACFVIIFSFLIPGTPGQGGVEKPGPDQPPGWSYNPSSWIRRWLGIALALLGFLIARYLAARQLGYFPHAWDPFFGDSSDKVLHSAVSRSFPISDAGFGGIAYILEVLAGFMGDKARWRTSPWVVTTFALLVIPLGVTSIVLVVLQPIAVGAWCGLCLIAAVGLLTSVPLAVHELIAMGQFLVDSKNKGKNCWQIFWKGGSIVGAGNDDPDRTNYSFAQRWIASIQGVTIPWTLAIQLAIGIWLMVRPDFLHLTGTIANCDHLLGALVITIAAVATAEVTRTARLLNIPVGILMSLVSIFFASHNMPTLIIEFTLSLVVIFTSLPKGEIIESYASWNKFVK
jgi:hypothetical protein